MPPHMEITGKEKWYKNGEVSAQLIAASRVIRHLGDAGMHADGLMKGILLEGLSNVMTEKH